MCRQLLYRFVLPSLVFLVYKRPHTPFVYSTGTSTLPGSAALGIVTVSTPSFNFADTLVGSTRLGNQTVRVKLEVPTNDRSEEIWFGDAVLTA